MIYILFRDLGFEFLVMIADFGFEVGLGLLVSGPLGLGCGFYGFGVNCEFVNFGFDLCA